MPPPHPEASIQTKREKERTIKFSNQPPSRISARHVKSTMDTMDAIQNISSLIKDNITLDNIASQISICSTCVSSSNSLLSQATTAATNTASTPAASAVVTSTVASHGLMGWIFRFIGSLILASTRIFVWLLSFATITIPTLIFKILSVSFTLTLNFSSLFDPLLGGGLMVGYF